ncbi:hypothetical protein [Planococcus faecalis]|uniref:hypothetical protein n=1 Tax=Planococcus faecalis TaxID=1598147 RepID=UPI000AFC9DED|nr:hypothetical protein [Planococcus faecalis]
MKVKGWGIALLIGIVIIGGILVIALREDDNMVITEPYEDTTNAVYNLKVKLSPKDDFHIEASIDVTNDSAESWSDIGFYLIPNAMNSNETNVYEGDEAVIAISSVVVNGKEAAYALDNNELMVELEKALNTDDLVNVTVDYSMTLPKAVCACLK